MAAKKVKTGVYTLTRDLDGEFALWPEKEQLERVEGIWRSTRGKYRLICGYPEPDDVAGSFPTIRKGTRARVRVTVEVISDE